MKKTLCLSAVALAFAGTTALAEPTGTFRQAHEYGFGAQSSLDPISKGRVFQITEKIMNRLVRPGLDGKPEADRWNGLVAGKVEGDEREEDGHEHDA